MISRSTVDTATLLQAGTKPAPSRHQAGTKPAPSWHQVGTKLGLRPEQVKKAFELLRESVTITELLKQFGLKDRTKFRRKFIAPLLAEKFIRLTIPEKPKSPNQKYILSEEGKALLEKLETEGV